MYSSPIPIVALTTEQFEKLETGTKVAVRKDGSILINPGTPNAPT
jgi:predicted aconitase with swiveling domain